MANQKDKWITPDNYHFQDVLDQGRCIYCSKLADHRSRSGHLVCPGECEGIVDSLIKKLSQDFHY